MMKTPQKMTPDGRSGNDFGSRKILRSIELKVDIRHGCYGFKSILSGDKIHSPGGLLHRVRVNDHVNETGPQVLCGIRAEIMHDLGH